MARPKLIVFASGTAEGGGTGFENLAKSKELDADIVAVVSNHERGGVYKRARKLKVPFVYFPGPYDAGHYREIVELSGAEWVALSGWLKKVVGLNPQKTFNIHPAPLSYRGGHFGGNKMYGHNLHEAVAEALARGALKESGLSMHFVTDEYDRGPVFFEKKVPLEKGMSGEEIQQVVNAAEHAWQPKITDLVVHEKIRWDGSDPSSLVVPENL